MNHHASVQQVVSHTRFIWVKVFDGSTNIIFIILTLHGLMLIGIKPLVLKTIGNTNIAHLHRPHFAQKDYCFYLL